jgi:RNA methyltransferase, TrmH family
MNIFKVARLKEKKHRKETGLFIVEGEKAVLETLAVHVEGQKSKPGKGGGNESVGWHIEHIHATADFCNRFADKMKAKKVDFSIADSGELAKAGSMEVQAAAIAVVRMPGVVGYAEKGFDEYAEVKKSKHADTDYSALFTGERVVLGLDGIKDPGNLGTIMRTADWFGVSTIICGTDTVDTFNPKTIAASMGSFLRVKTVQLELEDILASAKSNGIAVYTTAMKGTNLADVTFKKPCIIVMGSESHGVKPKLQSMASETITIPRVGKTESLNVGVAAGIILHTIVS